MVMKKITLIAIITFFATGLFSQTSLIFCTVVSPEGYCVLNNTKFISSPDSSKALIYMKVMNPKGLPTSKLVYKVYNVGAKGEETYYDTFEQHIQNGWDASWQPDRFPSPGKYMVRIFDETSQELCHKSFELRKDW
jgi:hypothetical protein